VDPHPRSPSNAPKMQSSKNLLILHTFLALFYLGGAGTNI